MEPGRRTFPVLRTVVLLSMTLGLTFTSPVLSSMTTLSVLHRSETLELFLPTVFNQLTFRESVGVLDSSFGGDGWVTSDLSGIDETGWAVALQPDGYILVAGTETETSGLSSNFALARYTPAGSLDVQFGDHGKVATDFGGRSDRGLALALQADGKIVVAGGTTGGDSMSFAMARYHSGGSLDTSFGENGLVISDIGPWSDWGEAVVIQADGKIVVAGTVEKETGSDFVVVRCNPDGAFDPGFGSAGVVVTDFSENWDAALAAVLQKDGKIVVAGSSSGDFALARYHPDGSLDDSFGSAGLVRTDFWGRLDYGEAVAVQNDGKIVVAGTSITVTGTRNEDFSVARYHPDGSLDQDFGLTGLFIVDFYRSFDHGYGVAIQVNGKILIAGSSLDDFALARLHPDGSLDLDFGQFGRLTTDFFGGDDRANAIALQPDGGIVVAGSAHNGQDYDIAVARYR